MIGVTRPSVTSYQQPVWELSSCQLSAPHSHSRQEDSSLTVAEREVEPGRPHWVIPARPRQSAQLPAVASCSCAGAGAGHQRPHYLNDVEWPLWSGRVPGGGQEGIPSSAPPAAAGPRTKAGCCSLAAPQQSLGPRSARLRSCRTLAAARGHCGAPLALLLLLLSVLCILRGLCCWRPLVRGDARPGVCSPRCSCTPLCLTATQHTVCHPVRCTESRYLDIYCGHYINPDNVTASFSWWKV